jgi:hypothetical protein
MLAKIQKCFAADRAIYTTHAREEMRLEELGSISQTPRDGLITGGENEVHYL